MITICCVRKVRSSFGSVLHSFPVHIMLIKTINVIIYWHLFRVEVVELRGFPLPWLANLCIEYFNCSVRGSWKFHPSGFGDPICKNKINSSSSGNLLLLSNMWITKWHWPSCCYLMATEFFSCFQTKVLWNYGIGIDLGILSTAMSFWII